MQPMLLSEKINTTDFGVVMFKFKGVNGSKEGGRQKAQNSVTWSRCRRSRGKVIELSRALREVRMISALRAWVGLANSLFTPCELLC